MFLCYFMLLFTDFVPDAMLRFKLGYKFNVLLTVIIGVNICIFGYSLIKNIQKISKLKEIKAQKILEDDKAKNPEKYRS